MICKSSAKSGVVYLNLNAQNVGNLLVSISTTGGSQVLQNTFITDANGVSIKNDKLMLMPQKWF